MVPNRYPAGTSASQAVPARENFGSLDLTEEQRAELLDPLLWVEVLQSYAATTRLAVALTDARGRLLGECLNPQPLWSMVKESTHDPEGACPFCLCPATPCSAVEDALRTGAVAMAQDGAGLAHVAVPISLGGHRWGALIAGQVFNRYPQQLLLQRVARDYGVSPQQLWHLANQQVPITRATLAIFANLLMSLGNAHLGQHHAALLQKDLAAVNLRYRLLMEGVHDYALYTIDGARCVIDWNSGAEKMFGYTEAEILGRDCSCLYLPEDIRKDGIRPTLQEADRRGWVESEGWRVRKDGSRFFAAGVLTSLGRGAPRQYGILIHDLTEQRKSAEALRQAQKLESIGVLAGGIAHDFNNLLAGILLGVDKAKSGLPPDHAALADLEIAENCSLKAAELTAQLLAYAGKGKFVRTRFDLSALVAEMVPLIGASISKAVQLQLVLAPDLPWIEGDASQIRQVVMNLIINGAEAIGEGPGTVRISSGLRDRPPSAADPAAPAEKPASEVYLEVKDSGSGMSDATRAKIFDPFFTTKFAGRGLGLAAVAGILGGHMGRLDVESIPGEGTTFTVFFPAVEPIAPQAIVPKLPLAERGAGTLLLADDEPSLRKMCQDVLEDSGYTVLLAENGQEAVEMFRDNAPEIATVLLDLTMPVMGGREAFRLIREIRPDVPVIFMTGFDVDSARDNLGTGQREAYLQKPYPIASLLTMVRASVEKNSQAVPELPS